MSRPILLSLISSAYAWLSWKWSNKNSTIRGEECDVQGPKAGDANQEDNNKHEMQESKWAMSTLSTASACFVIIQDLRFKK